MNNDKIKNNINGLLARIKSAYYIKNPKTNDNLEFSNQLLAYLYLKNYINNIKSLSDIIIFNDETYEIIINTTDKTLPLNRYVYINPANVNIDDLTSNIERYK